MKKLQLHITNVKKQKKPKHSVSHIYSSAVTELIIEVKQYYSQ